MDAQYLENISMHLNIDLVSPCDWVGFPIPTSWLDLDSWLVERSDFDIRVGEMSNVIGYADSD